MNSIRATTFGTVVAALISSSPCGLGAVPGPPADLSTYLFDAPDVPAAVLAEPWLANQTEWAGLAEDDTAHRFRGNPVFVNDKIVAVLAQDSPIVELYSRQTQGAKLCARLQPICEGRPVLQRTSLAIKENSRTSVSLEVGFVSSNNEPRRITYELDAGQPCLKTTASPGVEKLRVQAPCRFAILPDFFGDDIVVDASTIPVSQAELPSENFLLNLMHGGEAVLMTVSEARDNDIAVSLSATAPREILSSDISYGKKPHVWVALLAQKGVWHQRTIQPAEAGKIIRLDWQMPFPALWRVDWSKTDQLTESWEMLLQEPGGKYVMQNWFGQKESAGQSFGQEFGPRDWNKPNRQRWNPVLGAFQFPCWVDQNRQGCLQPLEPPRNRKGEWPAFAGPAIVYPFDRLSAAPFQTPLEELTMIDLVRMTLGVGPCQFILDLEGQKRNSRGVATCYARDVINAIYKEGSQLRQGPAIEEHLKECVAFITNVRERIDQYVQFGHEMTRFLEEQKRRQPRQAGFADECLALTLKLDQLFERNRERIKTPAFAQQNADLFRTNLLHYAEKDASPKCEAQMAVFTSIGGAQDDLVASCRMIVKVLRQRAGMALAVNPELKNIATQIRERTQMMLRNPTAYEAPRH
ncbi:MAG: hypothetical protein NTW03_14690 [Verrucomicrobia bacterium]|nr:hypothetical protein [Verrucomicrobiota bacterium]